MELLPDDSLENVVDVSVLSCSLHRAADGLGKRRPGDVLPSTWNGRGRVSSEYAFATVSTHQRHYMILCV